MSGERRYPETPEEYAFHPDFSEGNLVISAEMAPGGMRRNTAFIAAAGDPITALEVVDEEKEMVDSPQSRAFFVFLDGLDKNGNRLGWIIGGNED